MLSLVKNLRFCHIKGLLVTSNYFNSQKFMATEAKRQCKMVKIGTHNGSFHCDEALACFMLKQLPEYKDAEIVRSRDAKVLDECDVVVDVGCEYDPEKLRFDHHQRTFNDSMSTLCPGKQWVTKLSSAGLIYLHFGHRVIAQVLGVKQDDSITQTLYDKVYEMFIEEVDAIDNGISVSDEKPRYAVTTTVSGRVGHLNPRWNEPCPDGEVDARFAKAMNLVGSELVDRIKYYHDAWWPARSLVENALAKRLEVDPSGEIVCFSESFCPWKDHLMTLEKEMNIEKPIKFVLFCDQQGRWRVQCVPKELGSFDTRVPLLEEWHGVRDQELTDLSGIPGCIFVHPNGFIGGNNTYDGALLMAKRTLEGKPRL